MKARAEQPILICYDATAEAARAIDAAADLLDPRRTFVLTVAPQRTVPETLATANALVPGNRAFTGLNEADTREQAESGATHARRAGLHAEALSYAAPTPWEGVVEVADGIDAAAIAIGSRQLTGLREFAEGSVSHELVGRSHRPVLLAPPADRSVGPVLIAYDGSDEARRAIRAAGPLLKERQAVVLYAVSADERDPAGPRALAEAGAELARRAGFDAVAQVTSAKTTRQALVGFAREIDAGVIVVGSRGLRGPREAVEYSVSRDVASHADRPVLVVATHGTNTDAKESK